MKKAIVITGTSSGIGQAMFDILVQHDEYVLISLSRRFHQEQTEMAQQRSNLYLIEQDFRFPDQLIDQKEMRGMIEQHHVEEIVLINNAGVVEPIGRVQDLDSEAVQTATHVNFTSPILLSKMVLQISAEWHTRLKIVNISSGAASSPMDGWPMYCATKAGAKMFFDVMSEEYADHADIQISSVSPGVVDTKMQGRIREANDVHFPAHDYFKELKTSGKLTSPEKVAQKILHEQQVLH